MKHDDSLKIEDIIKKYHLKPHVEGGFYQLLYEDSQIIEESCLPSGYKGSRSIWNAIYYLLPENEKCIFHRIRMNELWNFYLGGPIELYDVSPQGELKIVTLGHDLSNGHHSAYIFPKGHWIAAKPKTGSLFSFVSCVTAPGFTFSDWEKGPREELLKEYPHLQKAILMLTEIE